MVWEFKSFFTALGRSEDLLPEMVMAYYLWNPSDYIYKKSQRKSLEKNVENASIALQLKTKFQFFHASVI